MPFIPHTEAETKDMLETIGVSSIDKLFDEIPASLKGDHLAKIPSGKTEFELLKELQERSAQDAGFSNFIGAGAYEHHIPAAIWDITTRGEFYSAYTPYQAEASQGTLQLLYEFQTMIVRLTGLEIANASMYDGASALAEAILMAVRVNKKSKSKTALIPQSLHPLYRQTVATIVGQQGIELIDVAIDEATGKTNLEQLAKYKGKDITAVVINNPNFLGVIDDVDALCDFAKENQSVSIAVVNPTSLALLKPPGEWGSDGVDIACGEGQPFGVPLASGGPYFGFLTAKMKFARQMPGRISGRTVDVEGKQGFTLTLQAREQHIRRSKATSNICTNQGLLVTAATIYMSLLGDKGLTEVAQCCHHNMNLLTEKLTSLKGVSKKFSGASFHECVIELPKPAKEVLRLMRDEKILAGFDLGTYRKDMANCLLVCVTETKTSNDLDKYVEVLQKALGQLK